MSTLEKGDFFEDDFWLIALKNSLWSSIISFIFAWEKS